mmetsp:Transcript_153844/g.493384  ORF Transcript_153844/g.493384 Transcript_153844/m.493384 type:complete len:262 (-) Transcript_153844:1289-2074(-)
MPWTMRFLPSRPHSTRLCRRVRQRTTWPRRSSLRRRSWAAGVRHPLVVQQLLQALRCCRRRSSWSPSRSPPPASRTGPCSRRHRGSWSRSWRRRCRPRWRRRTPNQRCRARRRQWRRRQPQRLGRRRRKARGAPKRRFRRLPMSRRPRALRQRRWQRPSPRRLLRGRRCPFRRPARCRSRSRPALPADSACPASAGPVPSPAPPRRAASRRRHRRRWASTRLRRGRSGRRCRSQAASTVRVPAAWLGARRRRSDGKWIGRI